ncbi:MAG: hypothetical protein M0T71_10560 [Actinomycetota bacterium]|nr:hypothetical protein [Actinomycetota bacterium]
MHPGVLVQGVAGASIVTRHVWVEQPPERVPAAAVGHLGTTGHDGARRGTTGEQCGCVHLAIAPRPGWARFAMSLAEPELAGELSRC